MSAAPGPVLVPHAGLNQVVLSHDAPTDQRGKLGSHAARVILPVKLKDRGTFTSNRVHPDLAGLDRREIWRNVGVWVLHT